MPSIFSSPLLETALCMVLVFALLSLLASSIVEIVNTYFKEREKMLYTAVSRMFDDNINVNFGQLLYSHPIVENLRKDRNSLPKYINPEIFSNVIIDVVNNYAREYKFNQLSGKIELNLPQGLVTSDVFASFFNAVKQMKHTDLKLVLMNICEKCVAAEKPLEALHQQLQQWYNSQMDRVTGWYKEKTGKSLWWVAALVAITMNVDSLHLFTTLYKSPILRSQLTPIAEAVANNYERLKADTTLSQRDRMLQAIQVNDSLIKKDSMMRDTTYANKMIVILKKIKEIDSLQHNIDSGRMTKAVDIATQQAEQIAALNLPIGWKDTLPPLKKGTGFTGFLWYLLGIFLTTYALKAGAPFWFELLVRFVNIRKTGARPDTGNK